MARFGVSYKCPFIGKNFWGVMDVFSILIMVGLQEYALKIGTKKIAKINAQ